jgi:hypothetical protein
MGILIHLSAYVQKVLEKINMNKAYPLRTLMIVRALEKDTDPFRPKQEGEDVLGVAYPYLRIHMGNHHYLSILCLGGILCTTSFPIVSSHTETLISFTQYMLRLAFIFGIETLSRTFTYISKFNEPYRYAVTTSINCKDRYFCIARNIRYQNIIPFIIEKYV